MSDDFYPRFWSPQIWWKIKLCRFISTCSEGISIDGFGPVIVLLSEPAVVQGLAGFPRHWLVFEPRFPRVSGDSKEAIHELWLQGARQRFQRRHFRSLAQSSLAFGVM